MKLNPCLSLCTKINSGHTKNLNVRVETSKLPEEAFQYTDKSKDTLKRISAAQEAVTSLDK